MSTEGLYERGIHMLQRKREEFETNNEEKIRKELEEVFDYPEINYKSRLIIGERDPLYFHEYSVKWQEDRDKKIEDSRKLELEKEKSYSPIRKTSTPPGYQSIITDWESRVTTYFERKNQNKELYSHTPEINSASRAMLPELEGKVEDRLNRYNLEKKGKLEELRKKAEKESIPSFTPLTNESNRPRPGDISDFLYTEGISMIEKRKKAAELCLANGFAFKPVINENSRLLASNRKPKVNKPQAVVEPETRVLRPEEFEGFLERNYVVKLKKESTAETPQSSCKKVIKIANATRLYEDQVKRVNEKEQKRIEILRNREMSELEGCTFKPKLSSRIKTPPPKRYKENSKGRYNKGPKPTLEFLRYEDKNHKIIQLKAFFAVDKTLLCLIEELERKVMNCVK